MKIKIYIIPGMGQSCKLSGYQELAKMFRSHNYEVIFVNPDWYRPISGQVFAVKKTDIIFGFSMGAVLAYLVAKEYPCRKIILASISPIHTFKAKEFSYFLEKHMSKELSLIITRDLKEIKVSFKELGTDYVTLVGEKEKKDAREKTPDFIVPNVSHKITKNYINAIEKLI